MATLSWRAFKALSSVIYFFLIIVTIPLAFDVGGEDCGIAFTGTLSLFYLILSTLRLLARNTKFGYLTSALYHMQQIIIPSLLILHLSIFSPPTLTVTGTTTDPSAMTAAITNPIALLSSVPALKIWLMLLEPWRWFLKNATPVFTTLEGFCSLLVIQTAGRVSTWLVRKRSDSWIIPQLLFSSCVISTSLYFLYRIYTFPVTISLASATLIGVVLTISAFLALFGIVSGRGNSVESSLLVSYIVYCLYFTFTDFQSSITASNFLYFFSSSTRPDIPPLPPVIINGYTNLVSSIASLVPSSFQTVFQFLRGAVSTVTPSVFVSLSYRLAVFFAATRIIPAVHKVSSSASSPVSRSQSYNSLPSSPSLSSTTSINSVDHVSPSSRIRKIRSSHNLNEDNVSGSNSGSSSNNGSGSEHRSTSIYDSNTEGLIIRRIERDNLDDDEKTVITGGLENPFSASLSPSTSASSSASTAVEHGAHKAEELLRNPSALSSSATISSESGSSKRNTNSSGSVYDNDEDDSIKEKYYPYRFNDHYSNEFNDNITNDIKNINNSNDYYHDNDEIKKHNLEYTNDRKIITSRDSSSNNDEKIRINTSKIPSTSNGTSLQFLILAYAPCILIAVYTHLLIQHLAIFNTITSAKNDGSISASRQLFESLMEGTSRTVVAFATTTIGRVVSGLEANSSDGSDVGTALAMSVGKSVVETAVSAVLDAATGATQSSSSASTSESTPLASPSSSPLSASSKALLIRSAALSIWAWSRSWVSTPRDSWQFWGWVNMFSTLALYALELAYGKQGANEDIIDYHLKSE